MDAPIVPHKIEGFTSTRGKARRIGERIIRTTHGDIVATDAPGMTTMEVSWPNDPDVNRVGVFLYAPGDDGALGRGLIAQLEPDQARSIAGSLVKLANLLDQKKPN